MRSLSIKYLLVLFFSFAIASCGGGSSSSSGTGPGSVSGKVTLSGTVATGSAIGGATIAIKDKAGTSISGTTLSDGKYDVDVTGMTAPFLLRVPAGTGYLYSVATASGTANIHPFTDLIIRNWYKVQSSDVETDFSGAGALAKIPTATEINTIEAVIRNVLASYLAKEGVTASSFNLLTSSFDANHIGFDKVLDNTKVAIGTTDVTVTATDSTTGITGTMVSTPLATNLATADTTKPSDPAGISPIPASLTSIVLVWNASTDNVGVAGFNIYRDGGATKVGTSPYPVYTDTGLTTGTSYCYQVEAFDAAGNKSAKSASVCATPVADTTAPSVPASLIATAASASQVNLSWSASTDAVGVAGYAIYRNGIKVASVNGTSYSDTGLSSGTLYSYTVRALDGALNNSADSATATATTQAGIPSAPTGVSAAAVNGQATISWSPVNGATSYNLYMATQSGVSTSNYTTLTGGMAHTSVTSPYVHTGLTNGTIYYFIVVAVNSSGMSVESAQVSATPLAYGISGTVSGAVAAGVTITVTDSASGVFTTLTAANGTYNVTDLSDGTYTVTPSLTGYTFTPSSASATLAGANVTGKNFTSAVYVAPTYTLSGNVSGPWIEGVTVTLSGAGTATTTTNASGNYSFANLPAGTYTVTPSLAGYTYSPAAAPVPLSANTNQSFIAASAIASYSISGTVSYAGAKTGGSRVRVFNSSCTGCSPVASITLPSPGTGAYTIRGLQNGSYTVQAGMGYLGTGQPNATNPNGSTTVTVSGANLSIGDIAMTDPAAPTATTPTGLWAFPGNGSALILWDKVETPNGTEKVTSYKIYWGTDTLATNGTPIVVGSRSDTFYVHTGLTDGAQIYYKIASCVSYDLLCTSGEGTASAVVGPFTIGATTGLNTVSGTVTFPGTPTGRLNFLLYNPAGPLVEITSLPVTASPMSYSLAGVANGNNFMLVFIDSNGNGVPDTGELNLNSDSTEGLTVSGNTTRNVVLTTAGSNAKVNTRVEYAGASLSGYELDMRVFDGYKRVRDVTLVSAANIAVPLDMGRGSWSFDLYQWLNTTAPTVGSTYKFRVSFSDNTTEDISASVTGVLGLANMAQNLAVQTTTPGTPTVPLFNWTAPASPPASYSYDVRVTTTSYGYIWETNDGVSSGTLSLLYNSDGNASTPSLTVATPYYWFVTVRDANGNKATQRANYTP